MKLSKIGVCLLMLFMCSCALPTYQTKTHYYDKERDFKVTISSDFEKCKNVGIKAMENEKVLFEMWERGGGKEITFFINDKKLKLGENTFKIYCDDKEYRQTFTIKNSRFPLMNAIYTDNENMYKIALNSTELFKDNEFYNEFKYHLLLDKNRYYKTKDMIDLLPSYFKVQLFFEISDKFSDELILRGLTSQIQSLLFEEKTEELITKLFKIGNKDIDSDLTYIILSKPVKRYYEKFFQILLTKPHTYHIIEEHLRTRGDTEFSKLVFDYIKDNAEKGSFNSFVNSNLSLLLEREPALTNYTTSLLIAGDIKKEELALKIYKERGIDEKSGQFIMNNWDKLSELSKKSLVYEMMRQYGKNESFFKRFLKTDDQELKRLMCQVGLSISSRYTDKDIIDFYLSNNRDDAYTYFLNAPVELKFRGLSKFYEMEPNNIATLLDIGKSNPKYFAEKLVENFISNPDGRLKAIAAQHLAEYKEEYLPVLIKAYESESNPETRQPILSWIATTGVKGNIYAYEKVKNEPNIHTREEVYRKIARYAEGEVLSDILNKLKDLPDEIFKPISIGFEESKKNFNCEVLKDVYRNKYNNEIRSRVIWTWAYCCPDSYFSMFKTFASEMNDEIFSEAIDGVKDIITDVKPVLKDAGFAFLEEIYPYKKTKAVREKIADLIVEAGSAKEYNFLKKLSSDAVNQDEKINFEQKINTFKTDKKIVE